MSWYGPFDYGVWQGIASDGTYIYASSLTEVLKINISDGTLAPDSPIATGLNNASYLTIDGATLYILDYPSGAIYTVDLTLPESQVAQPFFSVEGVLSNPVGFTVYDGYLYVANTSGINGISKISLTNPSTDYTSSWATIPTGLVGGLVVSNDKLLVTDQQTYIYSVDFLNPTNVTLFSTIDGATCYGITEYQNYIYVANGTNVSKLDLTGNIITNPFAIVTNSDCVVCAGDYLYCTTDYNAYIYRFSLLPPPVMCFKEGSTILSLVDDKEQYIPIQDIRTGTLIKTSLNGYVPVHTIGTSKLYNSHDKLRGKNRLYRLTKHAYPELTEDLIITGCHSVLVDELSEKQRNDIIDELGRIMVTDKKYRLMAIYDERADPYEEDGIFDIWHLALEHADPRMNYGVYANGGLLVETTSQRMLKEFSGMTLV